MLDGCTADPVSARLVRRLFAGVGIRGRQKLPKGKRSQTVFQVEQGNVKVQENTPIYSIYEVGVVVELIYFDHCVVRFSVQIWQVKFSKYVRSIGDVVACSL